MANFKCFIIYSFLLLPFNITIAQESIVYVKRLDKGKIEIHNQSKSKISSIESSNSIIKNVSVSPKGKYIAFIDCPKDVKTSNKNSLKIYSSEGELLHFINDDVRKYSWNANDENIALISGANYEGGIGFSPENVIIYNLGKKSKESLGGMMKEYGAYDVAWSPDNSKLYIKTLKKYSVFQYDISTKTLVLTNFNDIYFSPDGKYYYQKRNFEINKDFAVFNATTNEKIKLDSTISRLNNLNKNEYGKLLGWAPDEDHVLLFENVVEDVKYKDIVLQEKSNDKDEIILRDYLSREVKGINYKFFDVKTNSELRVLKTSGAENELISSPNKIIYKENGNNQYKEFKLR